MHVALSETDIAVRIVLTLIAGFLIGFNRGEHGRPAGIRTTMLVCLAASLAMLQANFMLGTNGKAPDSFVNFDVMRLPLGILTGVGFIGAGAIVKRGHLIVGVTTAATLWYVTVIGLCLGGGQIELGIIGTVLGLVVLWGLKYFEAYLIQDLTGFLTVEIDPTLTSETAIRAQLTAGGLSVRIFGRDFDRTHTVREHVSYTVHWKGHRQDTAAPAVITQLRDVEGVRHINWRLRSGQ